MREIEALYRQLKESVDDGDFIAPDKAKEMLGLLESALRQPEELGDGRVDAPLTPSEEIAYEVFGLCDASSEFAPSALMSVLRRIGPDDTKRLSGAVCEASDIFDFLRFQAGPSVAPDVFVAIPGDPGVVYWMRLRQAKQVLEDKNE